VICRWRVYDSAKRIVRTPLCGRVLGFRFAESSHFLSLSHSTISIHLTQTIHKMSSHRDLWAGGCSDSASRNPRTACASRYPCTPRQTLAFACTVSIRLACYLWARCRAVHINSQNRSSSKLLNDTSHGRLPLCNGFTRPNMYTSYSCFLVELDD
jgi:hypothetical protein